MDSSATTPLMPLPLPLLFCPCPRLIDRSVPIAPLSAAALALLPPGTTAGSMTKSGPSIPGVTKPYVLAQQYVADPLLINGCKSGIRVWLLVTGIDPLRAYLHTNGLVLFSTTE